jgi:hypothetical protein
MQDPDVSPGYLAMADTKPSLLLDGEVPLLLDIKSREMES